MRCRFLSYTVADGHMLACRGTNCAHVPQRTRSADEMRRSRDELRNLAAKLHGAREEERAHIARELHDEVGQTLTSLKLELLRTVKLLQRLKIPRSALDRVQSLIGLTE